MNIYRYWQSIETHTSNKDGAPWKLKTWGSSNKSAADALENAKKRQQAKLDHLSSGESFSNYEYWTSNTREELLDEFKHKEQSVAVITRNRYGALILNTAYMLFVDIDIYPDRKPKWLRWLLKQPHQDNAWYLSRIHDWQQQHAAIGLRVYRTAAGLRLIVINRAYVPGSKQAETLMTELSCDPIYMRLCKGQASFRSRLSPKPWRMQLPMPAHRWPRETSSARSEFRQWLAQYQRSSRQYGVCELIETLGPERPLPEFERLIRYHDGHTLSRRELPLA